MNGSNASGSEAAALRPVLSQDGLEHEFVLADDAEDAWVRIGSISVHLKRTCEGVVVDLYPYEAEDADAIAGTWATFDEAGAEVDAVGA
jgi:hypothetical protein